MGAFRLRPYGRWRDFLLVGYRGSGASERDGPCFVSTCYLWYNVVYHPGGGCPDRFVRVSGLHWPCGCAQRGDHWSFELTISTVSLFSQGISIGCPCAPAYMDCMMSVIVFVNRKSETYVPLNTARNSSRNESSSGSEQRTKGPKYKSEKDIRIFPSRSYRVKNLVLIKFCKIVKYKFLLFLDLQKYNLYHIMCPSVSNL